MHNIWKIERNILANKTQAKKVYVGMSGGVDSSVSAYLLKKEGYDVTGVFIRVWQPEGSACTWKDERRDAMRVAAHLDIPFVTLDLRDAYKKGVVDYMIREYKKGNIPNPDVMCNKEVKFGAFFKWARAQGADYIATGHYAEVKKDQLYEGVDANKDQSYFLWTLTSQDLEYVLFPIGHLEKKDVRKIGEKAKIPVFDKKDSQGVCFIGHIDMKEFLKEYIETKEGDVLDIQGKVIGNHQGALLYTHGERHAFNLFTNNNTQKRLYVISKDIEKNTITVGSEQDADIKSSVDKNLLLKDIVLRIPHDELENLVKEKKLSCRTRYRQSKINIQTLIIDKIIDEQKSTITITLAEKSITSEGQSVVLYSGNLCIGGGVLSI